MRARSILIALGEHKAKIIREAAEGPSTTDRVPACYLREHPNDASFVDDGRGGPAHAVKPRPGCWGNVDWTDAT